MLTSPVLEHSFPTRIAALEIDSTSRQTVLRHYHTPDFAGSQLYLLAFRLLQTPTGDIFLTAFHRSIPNSSRA